MKAPADWSRAPYLIKRFCNDAGRCFGGLRATHAKKKGTNSWSCPRRRWDTRTTVYFRTQFLSLMFFVFGIVFSYKSQEKLYFLLFMVLCYFTEMVLWYRVLLQKLQELHFLSLMFFVCGTVFSYRSIVFSYRSLCELQFDAILTKTAISTHRN